MKVAIIAALPGELKWIVNTGWRRVRTTIGITQAWVAGSSSGEDQWIAVCAGMGADAARRAFAEAEADGPLDRVLSVGWAGSLNREVYAPGIFIASAVVDAQTGERFQLAEDERDVVLVSTARVADKKEKLRLAATYGGAMVDMESAAIVRLAQMRNIPVCCVKAISDDVGAGLPDFNRFIDLQGRLRLFSFMSYILLRPSYWKALVCLARNSSAGARDLGAKVLTMLHKHSDSTEINGTGEVSC